MSTNTNASSGASQKQPKKEMEVKKVDNREVEERIASYTGNGNTILAADCIIYDVNERNRNENGDPAGSNVNAVTTGKQTTEELEKGNSVTIVARDISTLNKDKKTKPTDKKKAEKEAEDKTAEEK